MRFLKEYRQNNFTTYYRMIDICRQAIVRSRTLRRGFFFTDSQTIDTLRKVPRSSYDSYSVDVDDLTARLFHRYVHLIADRLSPDDEGDSLKVKSAVMLAEKELEAHEEDG